MEAFRKLNISHSLLKAIEKAGFTEPTEIQEKTIPLTLEGKDILGSSATGSGKTLAFGACIIEKTKRGAGIQALILTPTRELTQQVSTNLKSFSSFYNLNISEVYGGVSIGPQIHSLNRADIVVGTPGRILDHLERRTLKLDKVRFLVLDEADRMLDMGFIRDVEKIIHNCPKERQTLLFSATISQDIKRLASRYMKNPVHIQVESYVDPSKLHQIYYDVPSHMKFSLLANLLKKERKGLVMVFCNTRRNTDFLAENLKRHNISVLVIHGGLSQYKRNEIIKVSHSDKSTILIGTDIVARGMDIKDVSHVYNYDMARNSTEYIHRIGRTARAGKEGIAVSLVSQQDHDNFRNVRSDHSLNITKEVLPQIEILPIVMLSRKRSFRPNFNRNQGFNRNKPRQFHRRY